MTVINAIREKVVEVLPKQALRFFAAPYVAGNSMEAALQKARELANMGVASTIDVLGEEAHSQGDIDHYADVYDQLAEALATDSRLAKLAASLRPSISMKPSCFVVAAKIDGGMIRDPESVDWHGCARTMGEFVGRIVARGIRLTIDMENHQWTDFTLNLYQELFSRYGRLVGTVLQSRLHRTEGDIERLPDGCRIRLCIGIYEEPDTLAWRDGAAMKARMIPLARRLFEKNVFVEFATHDLPLIDRFVREIVLPLKIGPDRFETQTLLGVPRQRLINDLTTGAYFAARQQGDGSAAPIPGIVHRLYVPFAENWDRAIAYSRRRLAHSPDLFWTGLVNAPRVLYFFLSDRRPR